MPTLDKSTLEELSRFFAPAYIREEVEKLRGWQHQLALDTSFGRVIQSPTWISGVSIQNKTVDAEKLNVGELRAITAYTGNLVVSGQGGNNAGGSLVVAANQSNPLVSSITIRAAADANNAAGITFRNASGAKTVELKLDGSGQIGAGPAITWDTAGNVSIPVSLLAGGLTISNVTGGRIGGNYDLYASGDPTTSNFIRLDPTQGIGIFGPTSNINWNNAKTHLRLDGSAKFTAGIEILATYNDARLKLNATDGIVFEKVSTGIAQFSLNTSGVLRIRRAVIGSAGTPGSGERIEISDSEIAGYTGTNQPTFRLGTDGTGYIKAGNAGSNAIAWNATSVTISASHITTGTLNVANLTVQNLNIGHVGTGTFGGTYEPTSTNRLVWTKDASGNPLSYISPNQLWVETTSNQARFANTIRSGSTITDACALDLYQSIVPGPPKNYYAYVRMRYGSAFSDGPHLGFNYVPSSGYTAAWLQCGTTILEVTDNQVTLNKTFSGQGAAFTAAVSVSSTLTVTPDIRCSVYRPLIADTVLYIALPANGQFQVRDHNNVIRGGWKANGTLILNGPNSTTAGPWQGYIEIELGGNTRKIPYYDP